MTFIILCGWLHVSTKYLTKVDKTALLVKAPAIMSDNLSFILMDNVGE